MRRSLRTVRAALASAEQLRLPYETAWLRARLAEWLPAGSAERRALRDAAIESFAALGASFDLAAVRELSV